MEYLNTIYNVTSIGKRAFFSHYGLESIEIPNSIIAIGANAFTYCLSLKSIVIPNSVKVIGFGAFVSCTSLQNIEIPNSVNLIDESAFNGCSSLQNIEIPNSIDVIKRNLFSGCSSLINVKVPNSLIKIEENAFIACSSLSNFDIPNTVQSIGAYAFAGCSALKKIEIPNSITSIEESTFQNCSSLQHVEIPVSITSIGKKAFAECYSLKDIICKAFDPPIYGFDLFQGINYDNCILFVPDQSTNLYHKAEFWKTFFNIRGLSQYEETIEANNIILNAEEIEIYIGETFQLEATVLPEDTTNSIVTWSSSNEDVAIVSEDGLLTALNEGTTIITATCDEISTTCEVTVNNPIVEAEEILLNIEKTELNIGKTLQLHATILPEDTTDPTLTWNSSNENIATVSEEGIVTAISAGEVLITVSCGYVTAYCLITVLDESGVESLLDNPDSKISVYSVDGVLIKKECKAEDMKTLTKGIYIIVSGKDRYKLSI